jgi:hypothetical protein
MKNDSYFKFICIPIIAGTLVAVAHAAPGGGRLIQHTGTYQTSRGSSGSFASTTTRSGGVVSSQKTWTNQNGGTGTAQSQRVWSNGSATLSGSATGPAGRTTSWQGTAQKVAPGDIASQGTITKANGQVDTYTATDTRVSPGVWDKSEVITTPSGKTIDKSVDTSVADGQGNRSATVTGPNGGVFTSNAQFTQTVSPLPAPQP